MFSLEDVWGSRCALLAVTCETSACVDQPVNNVSKVQIPNCCRLNRERILNHHFHVGTCPVPCLPTLSAHLPAFFQPFLGR